jgi:hypothetical protein
VTQVRSAIRGQVRSAVRAGGPQSGAFDQAFYDGIHLDFRRNRHYVKAPGAVPTIAPFTTLFTFTGDNLSKYRGATGLLVSSATNTPRIEYDANGNCLGLLIEGGRTNLGLWSDDLTNAAWVKTTATTALTSTGPDGVTNSATRLTASAGNATALQTVVSGSATRAYSVWLRRITGTGNIDLTLDNGTGWTTKTLTTSWQRFDISQAAVTNPVFGIRIVTNGDAIDVYGNQLESAAFPSSLIPTTTGSVARAADLASRVFGSEVSQSVGAIVAELGLAGNGTGGNKYIVSIDDGTTNERHIMALSAALVATQFVIDGGSAVVNAQTAGSAFSATASAKLAQAYELNNSSIVSAGSAATDDTSCTMPTTTTARLGGDNSGTSNLFGHIRRLDYFPSRLSNAQLQQMTA